jgi:predicted nucleotidyltransferase
VTELLDQGIARVLRRFPEVAAGWLFGSVARGDARPESDVDVALLFKDKATTALSALPTLGRLAAFLEAVAPGRRIDVVLVEAQGPIFQHNVLREGRLVYDAEPSRRVDFESDAYVRYFDFLPTYRIADRQALDGFRHWLEGKP